MKSASFFIIIYCLVNDFERTNVNKLWGGSRVGGRSGNGEGKWSWRSNTNKWIAIGWKHVRFDAFSLYVVGTGERVSERAWGGGCERESRSYRGVWGDGTKSLNPFITAPQWRQGGIGGTSYCERVHVERHYIERVEAANDNQGETSPPPVTIPREYNQWW